MDDCGGLYSKARRIMTKIPADKLAIYQAKDGAIELPVDASNDTIWATKTLRGDLLAINEWRGVKG